MSQTGSVHTRLEGFAIQGCYYRGEIITNTIFGVPSESDSIIHPKVTLVIQAPYITFRGAGIGPTCGRLGQLACLGR